MDKKVLVEMMMGAKRLVAAWEEMDVEYYRAVAMALPWAKKFAPEGVDPALLAGQLYLLKVIQQPIVAGLMGYLRVRGAV